MSSRKIRKKYGNHHFSSLGRPTNLTDKMEWEICEKILAGYSNNKILKMYPIGLKTLKQIRLK